MSIKHLDLIKKSFQLKDKDIDKIKKNENIDLENYNWDSIKNTKDSSGNSCN